MDASDSETGVQQSLEILDSISKHYSVHGRNPSQIREESGGNEGRGRPCDAKQAIEHEYTQLERQQRPCDAKQAIEQQYSDLGRRTPGATAVGSGDSKDAVRQELDEMARRVNNGCTSDKDAQKAIEDVGAKDAPLTEQAASSVVLGINTSTGGESRLPGAYASSPISRGEPRQQSSPEGAPENSSNTPDLESQSRVAAPSVPPPSVASQVSDDEGGIAVATAVSDEELGEERVVHAHAHSSLDAKDLAQIKKAINRDARNRSAIFVLVGILVILAIVIPLSLILPGDDDTSTSAHGGDGVSNATTMVPPTTLSPTSYMEGMEDRVKAFLPDYTLEELEDPRTPQSRALAWICDDPGLPSYTDARILQRFSLATFFFSTGGAGWLYNDNWLSYKKDECLWYSYVAFAPPPEVTGGITGIVPENENPCELTEEEMADLEGLLPSERQGYDYKHIWMLGNQLDGTLPLELYLLTSLRSMSLLVNNLRGTISTHVGFLTNLEAFTFSRNAFFTGTLPTELGAIPNLYFLDATANELTGTIPSELGLVDLEFLFMDGNFLSGTIPSQIFSVPAAYEIFFLDHNMLTGTMPSEVGNVGRSDGFAVEMNALTGTIPSEVGLIDAGGRFQLSDNHFTGTIPTEIGHFNSAERLFSLELNTNFLNGTLPSEVGRLSNLQYFFANSNNLTGTVPDEVTALVAGGTLRAFNISDNDMEDDGAGLLGGDDGLCFVNSTYFEIDCWLGSGFDTPWYCGCMCACPSSLNATNTTDYDNEYNYKIIANETGR